MLFATFIVLLHAFPLVVHGCSNFPSCPYANDDRNRDHVSLKVTFSPVGSGQCKCTADRCETPNGKTINSGSAPEADSQGACINFCCENCYDSEIDFDDEFRRSLLQKEAMCYCNAVNNIPFEICPEPATNFEECSAQCNSTCFSEFGELAGCEHFPLLVDESNTLDEKSAKEYISTWQQSDTPGKVCVCETGFMIGTNNNITNFQEGSCDEFCLSLGSVKKFWLTTTDELITPPPTSSPTSPPIQKLNTWAVAFLSSVVCVGFLMIAGLFCKNNVGSRST
ncbi:hypothetical protein QTG54_008436 [Skeletonema marinoi]|uniref:Folate receptor-like domain-containing protein n=1 Tax=Skeletonema marinoi TaxID=267567 RepID=A0AAD8Y8X3_9STRA|nr:hypothetical protein QTG54_008436 [Skeletonema marinoi]